MVIEQSMYAYLRESVIDESACKLVYFGNRINAGELFDTIGSVAGFLIKAGIKRGDTVAIALPNIPEAIFAFYAVNAIGGIANLIHPRVSAKAFSRVLQKTGTKAVFIYDKIYKKHKNSLKNIPTVACSVSEYMPNPLKLALKLTEPLFLGEAIRFKDILGYPKCAPVSSDGSEPAVYIHSGGTMGEPKTVILSSKAFNRLAEAMVETVYVTGEPLKPDDVMLMMLPIFHGFGLGVCAHTALSRISTVLMPQFKPAQANRMIKKYGVTHLAGIPAMFRKMLKQRNFAGPHLKKIVRIFCGGDRLDYKIKHEFDAVLKAFGSPAELTEGYGLTEASAVFSVSLTGETSQGCQGRPLKGNAIKAVTEDGREAAPGEVGEFYISSPSLMLGYLGDPEGTEAVFCRDEKGRLWLKTGDLGYLDAEGGIHFKERKKRSLKIAAINIFPSEIEEVVSGLPEIKECCVVRSKWKGKPCTKLLVVLNEKTRLDAALENKIRAFVRDSLIKYAVPMEIIAVDSLKRTPFGKIDFVYYEKDGCL